MENVSALKSDRILRIYFKLAQLGQTLIPIPVLEGAPQPEARQKFCV